MPANWTSTLWTYVVVAFGGALGTTARFWLSGFVSNAVGRSFPWDILLINVTGSFVIGFFSTLTDADGRWLVGSTGRQFFMIGVCGGYTTFSSFSRDTLQLMRAGDWFKVCANSAASVVLCLFAVWLGHILAMAINSTKGK